MPVGQKSRTITLKTMGHRDEGVCGAVPASPGMAIRLAADGQYDQESLAQAAALKGGLKIAIEDAYQGKTIDDVYTAGDPIFWVEPLPGDIVNALVKLGEDIDVGDTLVVEGGGSGLFVETAGTETKFQLEALEDTGGALAANDHVRCKVIAP